MGIQSTGYSGIIKQRNEQIAKLKLLINETDKQIAQYQVEVNKCFRRISSCLPFGNSSDIQQIYAPGMEEPFDVLCNSETAGPGWIVIQQRINGNEDFDRNWANYSKGFGSFDGDFFLGLEKIHRLTSSQRHELYVHIVKGEQTIRAHYDRFEVASAADQYRLFSLGNYTGNDIFETDLMRMNEYMRFHTVDRDNEWGCSKGLHAGWWFNNCGDCNLNGRYKAFVDAIDCGGRTHIDQVQMLMRAVV